MTSAVAFESAFMTTLTGDVAIEPVPAVPWLAPLLSAPADSTSGRRAFLEATRGFDFLCPDYETAPLAPLLAYLRNLSGAPVRLLLVAHAPGTCPLEWALLQRLLWPGDRIIVPTRSALEVVGHLCPGLRSYSRVIPHPVPPLPPEARRQTRRVVALTRVHPWKLLHRQVEALALLRRGGLGGVSLTIAGPLAARGEEEVAHYARSLHAQVRRLGLGDRVELVGEIGGQVKGAFLARAALLVNLSVTVEESFGKAAAEALSCGVPVVATHWDGLPETVGKGGHCVPVTDAGLGMDVAAEPVADTIARLLDSPPSPDACRHEAERFRPEHVRVLYRTELEAALAVRGSAEPVGHDGAGAAGMLAVTAPLTQYSYGELLDMHLRAAGRHHALIAGRPPGTPWEYDELRALLMAAVRRPLGRLMAGLPPGAPGEPCGTRAGRPTGGDLDSRVATAAASFATRSSRTACLGFLANRGLSQDLQAGLASVRADGPDSPASRYLEVELLRLQGRPGEAMLRWIEADDPALRGELAVLSMRQVAAVARDLGEPAAALPWLREWLDRFPDAPGAGAIWLDRCAAALANRPPLVAEARDAGRSARELLGAQETPGAT